MKFTFYKDKVSAVEKARQMLKGTVKFWVSDDFTKIMHWIRSKLFPFMKKGQEENKTAFISFIS